MDVAGRRRIVEVVLPRFGTVALPAFVTLVVAGAINAATELGSPQALWSAGYGRVLLAKTALVCVVALLSYRHALRLRPRLLAAGRDYDLRLERLHWRLLASEPILGTGVFLAAALLVAYAPPIDLAEQVAAARPVAPATVRDASAAGSQLSVAGRGRPVHRQRAREPGRRRGQRRAADARRARASGLARGPDCERRRAPGRAAPAAPGWRSGGHRRRCRLTSARGARAYRVSLPIRYQPGGEGTARRLLALVEGAQRKLRSVAIFETLGSGTGSPEVTSYQVGDARPIRVSAIS